MVGSTVAQDFQALKDVGNRYYVAKEFAKAAEVYSSIIEDYSRSPLAGIVPPDLVRTALANRAASFIELGLHCKAIQDCTTILSIWPPAPGATDQFTQKVYYRLARSCYALERYDESLIHLDAFRKANGSTATDTTLRVLILEGQVKKNQLSAPMSPMQPFEYIVRVLSANGLQDSPLVFCGNAFQELCVAKPPQIESKAFLANLVKEHHDEIMGMRHWGCWKCPKQAVSILHNPMSWLHLTERKVIDFALPICQNRGKCDAEGRKFVQNEMALMLQGVYRAPWH